MKYNMREKNCAQKTPLTKSRESRALPGNFASQPFTFQCFMIHMKRLLILHVFGALLVTIAQGVTSFEWAAKATNQRENGGVGKRLQEISAARASQSR